MTPRREHPKARLLRTAAAAAAIAAACAASFAPSASAVVNTAVKTCEGQLFSQPFLAFGDANYYTLAPGGEFNSAGQGWTLSAGASIVQATRPGGATGGVLSLAPGAEAVSPPICVTLEYAKARIWLKGAEGASPVTVSVSYPETHSAAKPKEVGQLSGRLGAWTLSEPFAVRPRLAGSEEGTREVRFVFTAGKTGSAKLYGFWVDPRMKR
jgi:hypothetical protein